MDEEPSWVLVSPVCLFNCLHICLSPPCIGMRDAPAGPPRSMTGNMVMSRVGSFPCHRESLIQMDEGIGICGRK